MTINIPLGEATDRLSELVEQVSRTHDRVQVTKHGRPSGASLIAR